MPLLVTPTINFGQLVDRHVDRVIVGLVDRSAGTFPITMHIQFILGSIMKDRYLFFRPGISLSTLKWIIDDDCKCVATKQGDTTTVNFYKLRCGEGRVK